MTEEGDADYCRRLEAYLCRRNGGHLIRITGPAFDTVRGWEAQGIPLQVACTGVDRYVERDARKGARRRPVRIEFCEADVLDAFDQWRRAVGVIHADEVPTRSRASLATHLERASAQATAVAAGGRVPNQLRTVLQESAGMLTELAVGSAQARGARRQAVRERLQELDDLLLDAAAAALSSEEAAQADAAATEQLAAFAGRLQAEDYHRARVAARRQYVRAFWHLPTFTPP